jgi:hypothetical protein
MWDYLLLNLRDAQVSAEAIRQDCRVGVISLVGPEGPDRFLSDD